MTARYRTRMSSMIGRYKTVIINKQTSDLKEKLESEEKSEEREESQEA